MIGCISTQLCIIINNQFLKMITVVKLIMAIGLSIIPAQIEPEASSNEYDYLASVSPCKEDPVKEKAFKILTNKCNVCHNRRNKRKIFTEDNMNSWSQDVYKQVFIKKRMPKGKKIKLTGKEYQDLLTWVSSLKNNKNGNQL